MNGLKKSVCVFLLCFIVAYVNAESLEDRVETLEETVQELIEIVENLMEQLPTHDGTTRPLSEPRESDKSESVSDTAGEFIEFDNVEDLNRHRQVVKRVDLALPPGILSEGLRSLLVPVQFTILSTGLVIDVVVEDTGKSELNTLIVSNVCVYEESRIIPDYQVHGMIIPYNGLLTLLLG
jgi:hypothetical protein